MVLRGYTRHALPTKSRQLKSSSWLAGPAAVGTGMFVSCRKGHHRSTSSSSNTQSTGVQSAAVDLFKYLDEMRPMICATPEPAVMERLQSLFDNITPQDLGVSVADVGRIVGYQNVYESSEMTLCIFTLPKGSKLPMHDHPGMYVFGRLLFGSMRVKSYDFVGDTEKKSSNFLQWGPFGSSKREVVDRGEKVIGPKPVTYSLGPERGNLHEIVALEDSAFFDVLFPPYNEATGRGCNYYAIRSDETSGSLVAMPSFPHELRMGRQPYAGPTFPSNFRR